MKKWLALALAACLFLTACGREKEETPLAGAGKTVGVCLAGNEGDTLAQQMTAELQALGFAVKTAFAQGSAKEQAKQMEQMLRKVDCVIVQAVDSLTLLEAGQTAKEKNIPVIACDRMLMDTDWVWGCVSYDYEALGAEMAKQVVDARNLGKKKATIEFFMGNPEDMGALLLHKGAMSVFQPYLDSGKLVCPSGRVSFEDTYVPGGAEQAKDACLKRLEKDYSGKKLDICFAGTDEIAAGCRSALDEKGYTRENWPTLVGQGGENAQSVKDGYQLCTFQKDRFQMASKCAAWALAAVSGGNAPKETTVFNHVKDVPVAYLPATLVES